MYASTDDNDLNAVEQAIAQKLRTGQADESRYGFSAHLANATPPVDEVFQRELRARLVAELARREQRTRVFHKRLWVASYRTFAIAGTLAALVLLVWIYTSPMRTPGTKVEPGAYVPTGTTAELASADVDALADALNAVPSPRTVVVYPANYAPTLAGRVDHKVVPLALDNDPDLATIQAALGTALPPNGLVDLIIVGQQSGERVSQMRRALEQRLYRLYRQGRAETEMYGALERSAYVAGPGDVALDPIGARFEVGVELVAGTVLDDLQPGAALRMAFDWRVTEPVDDSLVAFVHLVRDDFHLVAQRDAIPGNGLFPVESWEPGEPVRDQFALQLPSELTPGAYELRVGIYDATSGQRYSLIEPEGDTYVVVQQLTLDPEARAQ